MQSMSLFLAIAKFADFRWKNADTSRTQGLYHVIHTFFESSLGKVKQNCTKFHHCKICVTDSRKGGGLFGPLCPWAAPKRPILNRFKNIYFEEHLQMAASFTSLMKKYKDSCSISINRSSHQRFSVKKVFLRISQNSQENTCLRVSFW